MKSKISLTVLIAVILYVLTSAILGILYIADVYSKADTIQYLIKSLSMMSIGTIAMLIIVALTNRTS